MRTSGKLRTKLVFVLTLTVIAASSGFGWPPSARPEGVSPLQPPLPELFPLPAQAIADFDGDRLPDRAELFSNGFQKNIHLTLSSPWVRSLNFSAETQQPGTLCAEDVDRDSDNDLVWVSDQQLIHTALWLNNGIGEFTRINEPTAYTAEIKRAVAGESRNGLLASPGGKQLSATRTSSFSLLARLGNSFREVPPARAPHYFHHSCVAETHPCISRYPKRGPPHFAHLI
jgi:hypothetical protein